jgi:hypothetical protein
MGYIFARQVGFAASSFTYAKRTDHVIFDAELALTENTKGSCEFA